MITELKQKFLEVYDEAVSSQNEVVDIFTDYFGEELVDHDVPSFEKVLEELARIPFRQGFLDVNTEGREGIMYFKRGSQEIQMTLEEAEERLDDGFVNACTANMIPFFEDFIRSMVGAKLDNISIVVKFPNVRVTNENDRYVDIQDLYAKIMVTPSGRLFRNIQLHRATYSTTQYVGNYAHSHLPGIPSDWTTPCFGSGPILSTMNTLKINHNPDLWGLLCYELDKYVTVESLEGVPYRRLEEIGADTGGVVYSEILSCRETIPRFCRTLPTDKLVEFIISFLKNSDLKLAYCNGRYGLGESNTSLWIKLSKAFANWYNENFQRGKVTATLSNLISSSVLGEYVIVGGEVYLPCSADRLEQARAANGTDLFEFKGESIKLKITDLDSMDDITKTHLVNFNILFYVVTKILKVINYRYGRESKDSVEKKCCYI